MAERRCAGSATDRLSNWSSGLMLKKWREGKMCCPVCVKHTESLEYVIVNEETMTSASSDETEFFDVSCGGLDHHMRVMHATILSEDLLLEAKSLSRRLVSSETLTNLTTFSEARHTEGSVNYFKCLVSSGDDQMTFYAKREKEAAKYFCLYLDHKGELCKLEDRSHPCIVEVKSANLHIAYNAWKTSSKIHLEANFTRTVSSLSPISRLNFTSGLAKQSQRCIGVTLIS